jgi:hypothetical protein
LPTFLHVDEDAGQPETEHPTQGRLPDLKLVTQPSTQLPVVFSSFASCAAGDIGDADGVGVVGDVRRDMVLRATARCFNFCGLATCFGASTTTLGRVVAPAEGVADIAVLLRPHSSSAIGKKATAGPETKMNEVFMAIFSQIARTAKFRVDTGQIKLSA